MKEPFVVVSYHGHITAITVVDPNEDAKGLHKETRYNFTDKGITKSEGWYKQARHEQGIDKGKDVLYSYGELKNLQSLGNITAAQVLQMLEPYQPASAQPLVDDAGNRVTFSKILPHEVKTAVAQIHDIFLDSRQWEYNPLKPRYNGGRLGMGMQYRAIATAEFLKEFDEQHPSQHHVYHMGQASGSASPSGGDITIPNENYDADQRAVLKELYKREVTRLGMKVTDISIADEPEENTTSTWDETGKKLKNTLWIRYVADETTGPTEEIIFKELQRLNIMDTQGNILEDRRDNQHYSMRHFPYSYTRGELQDRPQDGTYIIFDYFALIDADAFDRIVDEYKTTGKIPEDADPAVVPPSVPKVPSSRSK